MPEATSTLATIAIVALSLAATPTRAQQYAGDVTENRYNQRALLSPANPYSLRLALSWSGAPG